ncbi:hypothetical protein KHO57_gp016 [Mycobacterium phage Phabba]|uniref:Uncharacterized protein n=1 Tax=Mycobacterium phage Phabba TaxID=2027899 RepID=A0A249XS82_9CAUD|nr:hypothetical protein KHO57_gp016 [Mycobacterium phage Phabba]ASZ74591.1 hypothetical protein SEA_PHABBA_16 [Mycobacterium phage Phabba]
MSEITHSRDKVRLTRRGEGPNTQWEFAVADQISGLPQQLIINELAVLEDLKALIGQVEHAAKVLHGEKTMR